MDIPSVFGVMKTGVQILMVEIHIFGVQQVNDYEICCKCHLVDDTLECRCNCSHCHHQDSF